MFYIDGIVSFSQTDTRGKLSIPALFNYFQDASEFHAESLTDSAGLTRQFAWILNSWQLQIHSLPELSQKIRVGTAPHEVKCFEAGRNFVLYDENGSVLVNANTCWTFVNKESFRPVKITEEQVALYKPEEPFPMSYEPRKISTRDIPEEDFTLVSTQKVHYSQLDLNGHLNNAQYAVIATDTLPTDFSWNQLRIEYKKSARLDDELLIYHADAPGRLVMLMKNSAGDVFAVLEFKTL